MGKLAHRAQASRAHPPGTRRNMRIICWSYTANVWAQSAVRSEITTKFFYQHDTTGEKPREVPRLFTLISELKSVALAAALFCAASLCSTTARSALLGAALSPAFFGFALLGATTLAAALLGSTLFRAALS